MNYSKAVTDALERGNKLKEMYKNKRSHKNIGWLVTPSHIFAIGEVGIVYETRKLARDIRRLNDKEKIIRISYTK